MRGMVMWPRGRTWGGRGARGRGATAERDVRCSSRARKRCTIWGSWAIRRASTGVRSCSSSARRSILDARSSRLGHRDRRSPLERGKRVERVILPCSCRLRRDSPMAAFRTRGAIGDRDVRPARLEGRGASGARAEERGPRPDARIAELGPRARLAGCRARRSRRRSSSRRCGETRTAQGG